MNLVGTLAKVAIGVMVSRGVGKMMGNNSGSSGGGLGGLLGGLASGAMRQGGGGLAGMLGSALSGGGAQGGAGGGLGGLLNSLGGGQSAGQAGAAAGGLGGLLNQMMSGQNAAEPTSEQNTEAEIMLRAMINAAKSDGGVDEVEQRKILEHLGDDVTQAEIDFVKSEMAQPLDLADFVQSVPKGLEQHVYVMSLLGIDLDSQAEAQYLDQLSNGLGISNELSNQIHEKVGVPALYS